MMCNSEHHDLFTFEAVDEGVRETLELESSSLGDSLGTSVGKLQGEPRGLFDCRDEAARDLGAGLTLVVASLSLHLGVRSQGGSG